MENNPFGPMLPEGWQHDSRKFWWMPNQNWKVDEDMRFPMHVDNVERTLQGMGDRGQPGMTRDAASWVNPGSELSRPWGTMLFNQNPSQQTMEHENHHLDGFVHPSMGALWNYINLLRSMGIKEPQ